MRRFLLRCCGAGSLTGIICASLAAPTQALVPAGQAARPVTGYVVDRLGGPVGCVRLVTSTGQALTTTTTGQYIVHNPPSRPFTITPVRQGFQFWPAVVIAAPGAPPRMVMLLAAAEIVVAPGSPGVPTITDTHNLPTSLIIPSGTFSQTTRIRLRPTMEPHAAGRAFAGNGFALSAGSGIGMVTHFAPPLTLAIALGTADLALLTDPAALRLYRWNGADWQEARGCTNHLAVRTGSLLTAEIDAPGRYALLGPRQQRWLPFVATPEVHIDGGRAR